MPKNFLEINRYLALTSYCDTIGQSNNTFSILGFSLAGKRKRQCFDLFIHWLIKQISNTYRNHFSKSYENLCNTANTTDGTDGQWTNLKKFKGIAIVGFCKLFNIAVKPLYTSANKFFSGQKLTRVRLSFTRDPQCK